MHKLILSDCDGVLLDWVFSFDRWMHKHNYKKVNNNTYGMHESYDIPRAEAERLIRMFNESVFITSLSPFRDAIKCIRNMH
jgi:FMN phosphatase YigB (HAD superfamily)